MYVTLAWLPYIVLLYETCAEQRKWKPRLRELALLLREARPRELPPRPQLRLQLRPGRVGVVMGATLVLSNRNRRTSMHINIHININAVMCFALLCFVVLLI